MFLFIIFSNSLGDDDLVVTQALVDSINNDPQSSFKAILYPQFASMTKKDFQKFLSPIRKPPTIHGSARPIGFSERTFLNSDKRVFTGVGKEILCTPDSTTGRQFSNEITLDAGNHYQYPPNQYSCSENLMQQIHIRYYFEGYKIYTDSGSGNKYAEVPFTVYNNKQYCSSWATAVTSAMTTTLSRWARDTVNLSIQFILDCDILGDPCVERPPLSAYEQFWRRYIPTHNKWRHDVDPLDPPSLQLTQAMCDNYRSCYPGETSCKRTLVMTGVCEVGLQEFGSCPVYFLYNWRWIKSHLAEVGAVTSSILARPPLFVYGSGIYSSWRNADNLVNAWETNVIETPDPTNTASDLRDTILGMLDVTIIGWGQTRVNLTDDENNSKLKQRWWYVIPHLGLDYGLTCDNLFQRMKEQTYAVDVRDEVALESGYSDPVVKEVKYFDLNSGAEISGFVFKMAQSVTCASFDFASKSSVRTGIIQFNRRFDDSNIESQAVGAVPYNFIPKPWRTPARTWLGYTIPPSD